jgi:hypothetical protein
MTQIKQRILSRQLANQLTVEQLSQVSGSAAEQKATQLMTNNYVFSNGAWVIEADICMDY